MNEENGGEIPTQNLLSAVADELKDIKGEKPPITIKEKVKKDTKIEENIEKNFDGPKNLKEVYLKFVEAFVKSTKTKALQEHLGKLEIDFIEYS